MFGLRSTGTVLRLRRHRDQPQLHPAATTCSYQRQRQPRGPDQSHHPGGPCHCATHDDCCWLTHHRRRAPPPRPRLFAGVRKYFLRSCTVHEDRGPNGQKQRLNAKSGDRMGTGFLRIGQRTSFSLTKECGEFCQFHQQDLGRSAVLDGILGP